MAEIAATLAEAATPASSGKPYAQADDAAADRLCVGVGATGGIRGSEAGLATFRRSVEIAFIEREGKAPFNRACRI